MFTKCLFWLYPLKCFLPTGNWPLAAHRRWTRPSSGPPITSWTTWPCPNVRAQSEQWNVRNRPKELNRQKFRLKYHFIISNVFTIEVLFTWMLVLFGESFTFYLTFLRLLLSLLNVLNGICWSIFFLLVHWIWFPCLSYLFPYITFIKFILDLSNVFQFFHNVRHSFIIISPFKKPFEIDIFFNFSVVTLCNSFQFDITFYFSFQLTNLFWVLYFLFHFSAYEFVF